MPIALLPAGNMKASNASLIQKLNFALARTSFPVESTDNIKIK